MRKISNVVDYASGQFILDRMGTNGGEVVLFRAVFVSLWVSLVALLLHASLVPGRAWPLTRADICGQLVEIGPWTAAFFGAAYIALYTRFVSQWGYLANVYNQIKQAEAQQGSKPEVINEWKAGFLEDADHLHLVEKGSMAPIIKAWGTNPEVADKFCRFTPGGERRLQRIVDRATTLYQEVEAKEAKRNISKKRS